MDKNEILRILTNVTYDLWKVVGIFEKGFSGKVPEEYRKEYNDLLDIYESSWDLIRKLEKRKDSNG